MAVEGPSHTWRDRPAPVGVRRPALARAMSLVLWLLAVSLLAQVIFAGLFLDGHDAWRNWHAANGMVLLSLLALVQVVLAVLAVLVWRPGRGPGWPAIASLGLLVAVVLQNVIGQAGLLAVHVPLGVAIVGLVGTLLGRTRNLTRPATHPTSS
jgi:hypothetical protein